jgi:hypothetical protein
MQLNVPQRTAPKNNSFDSQPAQLSDWIASLPMANIGQTTKLLYQALSDLNRQDIPQAQRFKALEMFCTPVTHVCNHMKKHYVGRPLPLTERSLKIAHLSREITYALATGYKVLIMEQIAGIGKRDRKLLLTSLHRAIKLLSHVLLKAYQVYEAYPGSTWLEVHSLYRYAESNDLHKTRVEYSSDDGSTQSTIIDTYKQILLLSLACPYRLRHSEAETVYQALEEWAPLCELQRADETSQGLFSVDLDTDQPPSYLQLRSGADNRNTLRVLDTHRLSEQVRKSLREQRDARASANSEALRENMLRHLMLAWGVMPKRRFSRVRDHAQVIVAMGLSSIHYFVSGEVAFNDAAVGNECTTELGSSRGPAFTHRPAFKARSMQEDAGRLPDIWEMDISQYHLEGDALPSSTEVAVARAAAGIRIDASHSTQNWKMVNVSAGGYCLLWNNMETTRAQVGELLGIRDNSDPDTFHWRLGVIRWLKLVEKRGLELGVQMLSPGAVGLAARLESSVRVKNGEFTRGLLLPEIATIQQAASLLLPSPPFMVGDVTVVNCHGKDVRVRLTQLVENTGSFAQFRFEALGEVLKPKHLQKASGDSSTRDFDDVWELL